MWTIEEPTNMPRSLLRLTFEDIYPYKYVFCPLAETIKAIESGNVNFASEMKSNLKDSAGMYGFNWRVLKHVSESAAEVTKGDSVSTLQAVIYRLHIAHELMSAVSGGETADDSGDAEAQKTAFRLQLFIDSHIDLCLYMTRNNAYFDSALNNPHYNSDDLVMSAVEQYAPEDSRVKHCGDLPDLMPCIDMGNIWYDVRPKPRFETIISAIIHVIACKTQAHKCQLRNFMRILSNYFAQYPIMISLFRMFVEVSMLGNYPHAKYRPPFEARMRICSSIRSSKLTNKIFFLWMIENDQFVYFATKEYYMYMVENQHSLDVLMQETSHWAEIKVNIVNAMDMSRTYLANDSGDVDSLAMMNKDMKQVHQDTLTYISKLKKAGFLELMIKEMNRFHEKTVVDQHSTEIQTSEIALAERDTHPDKDGFMQKLRDMQLVVDARFSETHERAIEFKWLKCFGISEPGYNAIRALYFEYELKDIADNAISKRIMQIYQECHADFHLIRVYFSMIQEKGAFAEYRLSSDYAKNQRAALRSKYFVPPWEELPETTDVFYYCRECERWLNPVVDPYSKKGKDNIYAQGAEKALYDYGTSKLYCGKQNTSISIKKLMDSRVYYTQGRIEDPKHARIIRKHKETIPCCESEVVSVHMLGVCKKLGSKFWALCEICGGLTQWEGAKFGRLGFTCERHWNTAELTRQSDIKKDLKEVKQAIASLRDDSEIEYKDEGTEKRKKTKRRKFAGADGEDAKCYYCGSDINTAIKRRVLEDDNNSYAFVEAFFCATDYEACKLLYEKNPYVRKSAIFRAIGRMVRREGMKTHIKVTRVKRDKFVLG